MKRAEHQSVLQLNRIAPLLSILAVFLASTLAAAEPDPIEVIPPKGPVRVNRPFVVEYQVSWDGNPDAYTVLPIKVDSVDGATIRLLSTKASVEDGRNVVSQSVEFTVSEPGDFKTPAFQIEYLTPEDAKSLARPPSQPDPSAASAYPSLPVDSITLPVSPGRENAWLAGGILGALFVIVAAIMLVRRVRKSDHVKTVIAPVAPPFEHSVAESELIVANKHRIDGNYYECYASLARIAASLPSGIGDDLARTHSERSRRIGYGGARPSETELDGDFRELRRILAKLKEDAA